MLVLANCGFAIECEGLLFHLGPRILRWSRVEWLSLGCHKRSTLFMLKIYATLVRCHPGTSLLSFVLFRGSCSGCHRCCAFVWAMFLAFCAAVKRAWGWQRAKRKPPDRQTATHSVSQERQGQIKGNALGKNKAHFLFRFEFNLCHPIFLFLNI